MLIRTGLPRPGPLALRILKAQEVTTKGAHVSTPILHAILYCRQTLLASKRGMGWAHAQFAEGLHFSTFRKVWAVRIHPDD